MITDWFDDDPLFNRYYPDNPDYRYYFENEWGIPIHNDAHLFELLSLVGFAAGLNWQVVLNKRQSFDAAFAHWNINQVAQMTPLTIAELLRNPTIIRNARKIGAVIHNANVIRRLIRQYGSFDQYLWHQIHYQQLVLSVEHLRDLPRQTAISKQLSKQMQADGFQFAGAITIQAWLVTTGLITARRDHRGIIKAKNVRQITDERLY